MQSRKSFREIAKECNVSPATVSRIANGIGSFKSETKELVMSHLLREGYMLKDPDEEARLRNIALAVTDLSNEIFCKIISHIFSYSIDFFCLYPRTEKSISIISKVIIVIFVSSIAIIGISVLLILIF